MLGIYENIYNRYMFDFFLCLYDINIKLRKIVFLVLNGVCGGF